MHHLTPSEFEDIYLPMQISRLKNTLKYSQKTLKTKLLTKAHEFLREEYDIELPKNTLRKIIDLYPYEKVDLITFGWDYTEAKDAILTIIANAFLGVDWPNNPDQDYDIFITRLKVSILKLHTPNAKHKNNQENTTPAPKDIPIWEFNDRLKIFGSIGTGKTHSLTDPITRHLSKIQEHF